MYSLVRELPSFSPIQIPFGLLPVNKQKPHKHVTIGFCRKQQVSSVLVATELSKARTQRALSELFLGEERSIQYLLWLDLARAGAKFCSVLMRNNFQGYSVLGHCMMLLLFILSLILIVALMYWMVRIAAASHCPDWWIVSGLELGCDIVSEVWGVGKTHASWTLLCCNICFSSNNEIQKYTSTLMFYQVSLYAFVKHNSLGSWTTKYIF